MSFSNLLKASYWFSQPDEAVASTRVLWIVLLLLAIGLGIAATFYKRMVKDNALQMVMGRMSSFLSTMGILGLVFYFMRQERVAFLGWRFWFLGLAIIFVIWLVRTVLYLIVRMPKIREEKAMREQKEKYLPKNK